VEQAGSSASVAGPVISGDMGMAADADGRKANPPEQVETNGRRVPSASTEST
jgi:hypothetical protein